MPKTKQGGRRKSQPVSQAMALEILQSAVGYCKQSGLVLSAGNAAGGVLVITIAGAQITSTDGETRFVTLPPTAEASR